MPIAFRLEVKSDLFKSQLSLNPKPKPIQKRTKAEKRFVKAIVFLFFFFFFFLMKVFH
jgi:hypothetical protein